MDANDAITAKDYLPIQFERSNAAQSLWNFEAVVVLGILAYVGAKGSLAPGLIQILLTIGFLGFAVLNLAELRKVSRQRTIIGRAIGQHLPVELDGLNRYLYPFDRQLVKRMHLLVDGATFFAIWYIPLRSAGWGRIPTFLLSVAISALASWIVDGMARHLQNRRVGS